MNSANRQDTDADKEARTAKPGIKVAVPLLCALVLLIIGCSSSVSVRKSQENTEWKTVYFKDTTFDRAEILYINGRKVQQINYLGNQITWFLIIDTLIDESVGGDISDSVFNKNLSTFSEDWECRDSLKIRFWKPVRRNVQYAFTLKEDQASVMSLDITYTPVFDYKQKVPPGNHKYYAIITVLKNGLVIESHESLLLEWVNGKVVHAH
jgi:hypothetical protein